MVEMLFRSKFQRILVLVGCVIFQMKIILTLAEKQDWEGEYRKDKTEQKMFELFAEGKEDLTPKCWSLTSGGRQLGGMRLQWNDDNNHIAASNSIQRRITYICGILSNVRFSPKFCRWAFYRKTWRDSWELWSKIICCILLIMNYLTDYSMKESRKPGWRPLQASCSWVVRRNAWRPQLHQHNRKTKRYNNWVQVQGYPWRWNSFFHGQSQDQVWRNMKAKYLLQIAPIWRILT